MSAKALKTIWWAFALFTLTFSTFAFLRTRGLKPKPDLFGIFDLEPSGVPALALPVEIVLVTVILWLTWQWVNSVPVDSPWPGRLPLPHFDTEDIDPTHPGGRAIQTANIILFLIAPVFLLLAMCVQYWMATIYFSLRRGPTVSLNLSEWSHFNTSAIYSAAAGRDGFFVLGYEKGPQYFPPLTWVYAGAVLALLIFFAFTLRRIFSSLPQDPPPSDTRSTHMRKIA
jgi:hypothetical protein